MANENAQLAEFADNLWKNYIQKKYKDASKDTLAFYRAKVISNDGGNRLTIQKPYDTTSYQVRCTDNMNTATAGLQVLVITFGNGVNSKNHLVVAKGDGIPLVSGGGGGGGTDHGIPTGGSANQVLAKNSGTDYDASWKTASSLISDATTSASGLMSSTDKTKLDGLSTIDPATATPLVAGTGAVGSSTKYAREDHVHPAQTSVSGNAGTATALATARSIDGVKFDGTSNIVHFGYSNTQDGTTQKEVTLNSGNANFELVTGAVVYVQFTYASNDSSPTLKVGSSDAKYIRVKKDTSLVLSYQWVANQLVGFVYDGTYWVVLGEITTPQTSVEPATATPLIAGTGAVGTSLKYAREDHVHPAQTVPQGYNSNPEMDGTAASGVSDAYARGDHVHPTDTSRVPTSRTINGLPLTSDINITSVANADTADALTTLVAIDGVYFSGTQSIHHYATCSTEASTAAKVATISGNSFSLTEGAIVYVKFTYADSSSSVSVARSLNVNGSGAKPIRYKGASSSRLGWTAGEVVGFVYDGTNWNIISEFDTNTTYSAGTTEILTTGTDQTSRVWDAKVLHDYIASHGGGGGGGGGTVVIGIDESTAVGTAIVGTAVTGTANYTPSGDILYTDEEVQVTGDLDYSYSGYVLSINGITNARTSKKVVTSIEGFSGNGVTFTATIQ